MNFHQRRPGISAKTRRIIDRVQIHGIKSVSVAGSPDAGAQYANHASRRTGQCQIRRKIQKAEGIFPPEILQHAQDKENRNHRKEIRMNADGKNEKEQEFRIMAPLRAVPVIHPDENCEQDQPLGAQCRMAK